MPLLTSEERIGTEIGGRYRIVRLLGEGAFGAVFSAEHTMTGRSVAIKLLHAHLVQTEQISQRFLLEAQVMAKIAHPGIVQVLDAGREADGSLFLALELLNGETLESLLARSGRMTTHEAVTIGVDVLDALAAAHAHSIIHRDIKPGNIFLARENDGNTRAKLLDFGIALVAPKGGGKLTNVGMVLGTPEYMSPEQGRGGNVGPQSDLWSTGVVIYEMLSGVVPWSSESATAVLLAVASDPVTNIATLVPDVPGPIVEVLDHALDKEPSRRFATAVEMRDALSAAAGMSHAEMSSPSRSRFSAAGRGNIAETAPSPASLAVARANALAAMDAASSVAGTTVPGSNRPVAAPTPAAGVNAPGANRRNGNIEFEFDPNENKSALDLDFGGDSLDGARLSMPEVTVPPRTRPRVTIPEVTPGGRSTGGPSGGAINVPAIRPSSSGTLAAAAAARIDRGARAAASANQPPPKTSRTGLVVGIAVLLLGGAAAAAYVYSDGFDFSPVVHATDDPGPTSPQPVALPPLSTRTTVTERFAIRLPFGLEGGDDARTFARHVAIGARHGTEFRSVVTCARGTVYVFQGGDGLPVASGRAASIACEQRDLAVVPDQDGDGHDDIAAVAQGGDAVVVLSSVSMHTLHTIASPRLVALVGGLVVRGQPALLAYSEPDGPAAASQVEAISVHGDTLWHTSGTEVLARFGQPDELGLDVGTDATGDGVPDVVVGSTVLPSLGAELVPARARCVELLSGANGRRVWPEPFCQLRGGYQSVSLGPDVDGDGKGDVVVGTDRTRGADARVVIVSGATGLLIRAVVPPSGPAAQGFGWPVTLGPDLDGDDKPDVAVGSVGSAGTFVTLVRGIDGRSVATQPLTGSVGYPNLRLVITDGLTHSGVSLLASGPEGGVHVFGAEVAPLR